MTGPSTSGLPGGHSEWEPPDPFSNSEVKTLCADASVDFVDVKVGHCQALNVMKTKPPPTKVDGGFFVWFKIIIHAGHARGGVVPPTESVDVLIVGAGLSGVGAAVHLQRRCPSKSFAILEARGVIGGTWDLFRFPGVRSDSDMYTLGYSFRPWAETKAIADGYTIRRYISDTAREAGIDGHIRFGHKVTRASWSSDTALWTIEALCGTAAPVRLCCRFLYVCGGCFSYESAYRPRFPL